MDRCIQAAVAAGVGHPRSAHIALVKSIVVPDAVRLFAQLRATTGVRRRVAAELYARLGRVMIADRYTMTFVLGVGMIRVAAKVLGDQRLFDEIAVFNGYPQFFLSPARRHVPLNPWRWPVSSSNTMCSRACGRTSSTSIATRWCGN